MSTLSTVSVKHIGKYFKGHCRSYRMKPKKVTTELCQHQFPSASEYHMNIIISQTFSTTLNNQLLDGENFKMSEFILHFREHDNFERNSIS